MVSFNVYGKRKIYIKNGFDRKSIEIWFNHLQEMTKEVGAFLTVQMQKTFGFY